MSFTSTRQFLALCRRGTGTGLSFALVLAASSARAQEAPAITVTGADEALEENILASLTIENEACRVSITRLERLLPQVNAEIREAGQALGYYHLQAEPEFMAGDACWSLNIAVEPGAQVTLTNPDIELFGPGSTDSVFDTPFDDYPLQEGDVLNHGRYENFKNALSSTALDNGYFNARFLRSEVAVDPQLNTADLTLHFDTGEAFRLGNIQLQNDTPLNSSLVERLMGMEAGDPYSSSRMFELRENLDDSQYFEQIEISPRLGQSSGNTVPVTVRVSPRPRRAYSAGVGFTTDTGPRMRLTYDDRYFTASGHKLETEFGFSEVRQEIEGRYRIPLSDPTRKNLELRSGLLTEETDTFDSSRFNLMASYLYELRSGWHSNWFVNYQLDDYTIEQQEDRSTLTLFGFSLTRSQADNIVFPRNGWYLSGLLQGASEELLSDTTLVQARVEARYIFSLGRFRFINRLEGATTWIDDKLQLPASLRFFAGGDQSLRGYKYQTLGPEDEEGNVIGGKHKLTGTVEMDFRIHNRWRGAVFYDGGNAFSDFTNIDWKHSVGLGVRWISPIGPIRIDVAHPLKDGGVRLHVTMGPDL